jgi:hypothetical protein
MQIIDINLKLEKKYYPLLFQLKKKDKDKIAKKIFSIGYSILYPKLDSNNKSLEYKEIIQHIESLKDNLNTPELNNKITSLECALEKLIGLSSSSNKKGILAENILENIFQERYGDITYINKTQISHCGDAWLYLPNDKIIMLESKNYTTIVNKDEVIKMQNDMITNHIKWGIFVSFNSSIQTMKELDFFVFNHNNENYHIVMVSNLSNDITRLDLALSLLRKLILLYSDLNNFPWIVNNIKTELNNLNDLLELNYLLRDNFITMEKDIIKNINTYYTKLRDYQFNLDSKIKDIINKISSTMIESTNINTTFDYSNFIKLSNNKSVASLIVDSFQKKGIILNNQNLIFKDTNIGEVKFLKKKIIIELTYYDIILNFVFGKDKEILQNLSILENLIL